MKSETITNPKLKASGEGDLKVAPLQRHLLPGCLAAWLPGWESKYFWYSGKCSSEAVGAPESHPVPQGLYLGVLLHSSLPFIFCIFASCQLFVVNDTRYPLLP
jgi:hypothetical protein